MEIKTIETQHCSIVHYWIQNDNSKILWKYVKKQTVHLKKMLSVYQKITKQKTCSLNETGGL